MIPAHRIVTMLLVAALAGCQQSQQPENASSVATTEISKDHISAAATQEVVAAEGVPAEAQAAADDGTGNKEDYSSRAGGDPGMMGRGRGMTGRGHGGGNREDMTTLHAMFADRDRITRTVKNLPNGAEAITESNDEEITGLIQEHVPAMEGRVMENNPLPVSTPLCRTRWLPSRRQGPTRTSPSATRL